MKPCESKLYQKKPVKEDMSNEACSLKPVKGTGFSSFSPVYPQEEQDEETVIDDDAELHLNKVEEDIDEEDEADMEDEEHILGLEDLKKLTKADAVNQCYFFFKHVCCRMQWE